MSIFILSKRIGSLDLFFSERNRLNRSGVIASASEGDPLPPTDVDGGSGHANGGTEQPDNEEEVKTPPAVGDNPEGELPAGEGDGRSGSGDGGNSPEKDPKKDEHTGSGQGTPGSGSAGDEDQKSPNIGNFIKKGTRVNQLSSWENVIDRSYKPIEVSSPMAEIYESTSEDGLIQTFGKKCTREILPLIDSNSRLKLDNSGQYGWESTFSVRENGTNTNFLPTPIVVEKCKLNLMQILPLDSDQNNVFVPVVPTNDGHNFVKQTSTLISETKDAYELHTSGVIKDSSILMVNQKQKIENIVKTRNYSLSSLLFLLNTLRRNCENLALEGASRIINPDWRLNSTGVKFISYQDLSVNDQLEKIVNQQDRSNPVIFLTSGNLMSGLMMLALMQSPTLPWLIARPKTKDGNLRTLIDFSLNHEPVFNFTTVTVIVPNVSDAQLLYLNISPRDFLIKNNLDGINDFIVDSVNVAEDVVFSDNLSSMLPILTKAKGWEQVGLSMPQCEVPPLMGFFKSRGVRVESVSEALTATQYEIMRACKVFGFLNTMHDTMRSLTWKERKYQGLFTGSGQQQSVAVGTKMVSTFLDHNLLDKLLSDTVGTDSKTIVSICFKNTIYLAFRQYYNPTALVGKNQIQINGLSLFGCSSQNVILEGSWASVANGLVNFEKNIERYNGVANCKFEISPFFEIFNSRSTIAPQAHMLSSSDTRSIHTNNNQGYPINIHKQNSYLGFVNKNGVYLDICRIDLAHTDDLGIEEYLYESGLDQETLDLFSDIGETQQPKNIVEGSTNADKFGDYSKKMPYNLRDKTRNRSKARIWNSIDNALAKNELVDVELGSKGKSCCVDTLMYIYKDINNIDVVEEERFCSFMDVDKVQLEDYKTHGMTLKDFTDCVERFNYPIALVMVDEDSSIYQGKSEVFNGYVPGKIIIVDIINKHIYPVEYKDRKCAMEFYFQTFFDTTGFDVSKIPNINNCTLAKMNWYINQHFTGRRTDRFTLVVPISFEFDEKLTYKKQVIAIRNQGRNFLK